MSFQNRYDLTNALNNSNTYTATERSGLVTIFFKADGDSSGTVKLVVKRKREHDLTYLHSHLSGEDCEDSGVTFSIPLLKGETVDFEVTQIDTSKSFAHFCW